MATATQVQRRRGTAAQVAAFTPALGEDVVDTSNNRLVVGDGSTLGGWPHAKIGDINGFVNKFRNGKMDVYQRGSSGTVSAGTTAYTADGWQISATGANAAWGVFYEAFASGLFSLANFLRISCASGLTACTLQQRIESFVASELISTAGAQPITVQWTILNASGGSITPQVRVSYATAQDNFAAVTDELAATNLQTIANGILATVAYTFQPSNYANPQNGYQVQLQFGGQLNAASGSVYVSLADIRLTPGVATGINNNPPPPEQRPTGIELPFCQRYFVSSYSGVAPGTANSASRDSPNIGSATVASGATFWFEPLTMRASPTVVVYSYTGAAGKVSSNSGSDFAANSAASVAASTGVFFYNNSGGTLSGASSFLFNYTASAEL